MGFCGIAFSEYDSSGSSITFLKRNQVGYSNLSFPVQSTRNLRALTISSKSNISAGIEKILYRFDPDRESLNRCEKTNLHSDILVIASSKTEVSLVINI